jgi:hypothetical protein
MTHFAGTDLAGVLSNGYPLYARDAVRFGHRFISCRTGALVAVPMGFPRTQCVMAHFPGRMIPSSQNFRGVAGYFGLLYFFCYREKAGVFLGHHTLWAGAVVRQFGNRFIFCRTGVYLFVENEQWCMKTSRHDYHSIDLTAMTNDAKCLFVAVKHIWNWVRCASEPVHKCVAFVSSPCESVYEFVAAHLLHTFFQRAITH